MHHGLAEWQKFLSEKSLPILKRTKVDVQKLIDQPQLSITQYVGPLLFDACFSACVFKQVNTQRIQAGRNPLTTMDNALSNMGQGAFQDFLNKAPVFEKLNLPQKNQQGYMRIMGQSCHASLQAKDWAIQRNVTLSDEVLLAALLQNITELMLWCYGEDTMPKIEHACYVDKKPYEDAAREILGCGMRELGAVLAEEWNLPEMVLDGLQSKLDNFTLATGVALASELGREVDVNWYGSNALNLIERIARYKGKSEGEIERRLHMNAIEVTETLLEKGYQTPARLLPMLADDKYVDSEFLFSDEKQSAEQTAVDKPKVGKSKKVSLDAIKARAAAIKKSVEEKKQKEASAATKSSVAPDRKKESVSTDKFSTVKENKKSTVSAELAKSIHIFKQMVAQGKPAHELIEHVVKAMLHCGVERCVFMVKVPKKGVLVSRYTSEISEDIAMRSLKITTASPHVFTLLMEKTRTVFINDKNRSKYWSAIPDTVKLALGVKQFFAMSIFTNKHAMGLMYADKVKGQLTDEEFAQFQAVCKLLCKGIIETTKHKKPASE